MMQEFTQEVKHIVQDMIRDIHTAVPGKILSFDPGNSTASIQPTAKFRKPDGISINFPQIHGVPVYFPQATGQNMTFTWHIEPGDDVVLIFLEQSLDQWRTGGESKTELKFDLQNAVAFTGLFAKPNPHVQRAADNKSIIIQRDASFVELFEQKIEVVVSGTEIIVEPEKITMNTVDVVINADGNIDMTAGGDINITAAGNLTDTASRIDHN